MPDPIITDQNQTTPPPAFPEMTDVPNIPTTPQDAGTGTAPPTNSIPDGGQQASGPTDIPPMFSNLQTPKKKSGKLIATILGIFLLIGAIGAGVVLVSQKQLFQQKAGSYSAICSANNETDCLYYGCSQKIDCGNGTLVLGFCANNYPDSDPCNTDGNACTADGYVCPPDASDCCSGVCSSTTGRCGNGNDGGGGGNDDGNEADCNQITKTSTTFSVGSLFPGCYVNHYWCPDGNGANGCSDQKVAGGAQSASFSKDCGVEQIDLNCSSCPSYSPRFISRFGNPCTEEPDVTPTVTPTATPTPTPGPNAACSMVKAYDVDWNPLDATQLSALTAGDVVKFTISGTPADQIDKARFTINGILGSEITTKKTGSEEYYVEYTIPASVYSFTVTAQIHHLTLGWF